MSTAIQIRSIVSRRQTSIGEFVKAWRVSKDFSLRSLADQVGVSNVYIVHVENDRYQYPTEFIKKLYPLMTRAERLQAYEILCNALKTDLEDK